MIVRVRLFARYREAAGGEAVEVEVRDGASLAEVWERVRAAVPALASDLSPLFACDRAYAGPERVLTGTEEVAAFPPVSGG